MQAPNPASPTFGPPLPQVTAPSTTPSDTPTNAPSNTPRARRTREDHFREEAEKQTNRILIEIEKLSKLSKTSSNEYSPEQVKEMFEAIGRRLAEIYRKFDQSQGPAFEMSALNPL